jgi:hypothetical protein
MTAAIYFCRDSSYRGFDTRDVPTTWFTDPRFPTRSSAALASRAKSLVHVTNVPVTTTLPLVGVSDFGVSQCMDFSSP